MKIPQAQVSKYRAGALLLSFFCLLSAVQNCRDALTAPPVYDAGINITSLENRLRAAGPLLSHVTRVGFVTDERPNPVMKVGSALVVLQYVMYPIMVRSGTNERFVFAWFNKGTPNRFPGFRRVADYGDGIVLFQRDEP